MSLVPFALRIAAVRVLRAALPPGFVVLDSPQEPLDLLVAAEPAPFVAIYTGHNETTVEGRSMLGGAPRVEIALQFVLPCEVELGVGGQSVRLDTRKQGAETALDVLWRRGAVALAASRSPWAELWRNIVIGATKVTNASYLVEHKAVRAVAREIVVTCDPIHEPLPGAAPQGVWADLIALMRADDGLDSLAPLADWLAAEIMGSEALTQEARDAAYLGLSAYVAAKVGIGGAIGDTANDASEATLEASADPAG